MVQTFAVLPNGLGCGEVPAKAALNPVLGQTYRQTPFSAILAGEVLPNGSRIVMLSWRIKYDRSNSIRPIRPSVFLILARRQRPAPTGPMTIASNYPAQGLARIETHRNKRRRTDEL
jgi:hypothetical protein